MSEADARLIEQWRYPGEYAIYDEPRFSEIPACQREHFISFFEQDQLIGFVNLLEEETEVFRHRRSSAGLFPRRRHGDHPGSDRDCQTALAAQAFVSGSQDVESAGCGLL